jgi:hypothetical protein
MKINKNTRFSHPVLCEHTSDYVIGGFKVGIKVTEDTVSNSLVLECTTTLDEVYLSNIIKEKLARVFLIVSCEGTYFYKQIELSNDIEVLTFKPGELVGSVELRGIIASSRAISDFKSVNINEEYGGDGFTIEQSELLAFDILQRISVGHKKIPPMESMFELAFTEDMIDGMIDVSLDKDKVRILASKKTYESIHHLRSAGDTSSIVFSSIYIPAIMQVLNYLQNDGSEFSESAWYESFLAKCDHYNIDILDNNTLQSAQKLLKKPLNLVMENYNE